MQDSQFSIFLAFGFIWLIMGISACILIMKSEGLPLRLDKWGLVVLLPIVIPLVAALTFAAIYH
jgi:hypothetical protein